MAHALGEKKRRVKASETMAAVWMTSLLRPIRIAVWLMNSTVIHMRSATLDLIFHLQFHDA
jgi:hypothetical protein